MLDVKKLLAKMLQTTIIGEIKTYAGSSAPTGWLICDGHAVSRETYSKLFGVIGTTYGSGDGSTTFNLPNLNGRVPLGKGEIAENTSTYWGSVSASEVNCPLGERGGEAWHTLTTNQIPAHTHGSVGDHRHLDYHSSANRGSGNTSTRTGPYGYTTSGASGVTGGAAGGHEHNSVGGGARHNNMMPYTAVSFLIYAGK